MEKVLGWFKASVTPIIILYLLVYNCLIIYLCLFGTIKIGIVWIQFITNCFVFRTITTTFFNKKKMLLLYQLYKNRKSIRYEYKIQDNIYYSILIKNVMYLLVSKEHKMIVLIDNIVKEKSIVLEPDDSLCISKYFFSLKTPILFKYLDNLYEDIDQTILVERFNKLQNIISNQKMKYERLQKIKKIV